MGEMAEGLINGDFDFHTGEDLGSGYGFPRTRNKSLPWERKNKHKRDKDFTPTKEQAYNGVKNYLSMKWHGRKDMPSTRDIVMEYTGETNIDLKQKCVDIQKNFGPFVKFINQKIKTKR